MKRLTDEYGICTDCNGIAHCKTDCLQKQIYDKLKYYEDLEEQGKLIHVHHEIPIIHATHAATTAEEMWERLGY